MSASVPVAPAEVAGLEGLDPFQEQLLEHSTFIAALYGGVFLVGFMLLAVFTWRIQSRPLAWGGPRQRLLERPWMWQDAVAVVVPIVVVQALFAVMYWMKDTPEESPATQGELQVLMLQGVLFHGLCFLLLLVRMRRRGAGWRESFGIQAASCVNHLWWGVLILLGTMPLLITVNLTAQLVMQWWSLEPQVQDVTRIISSASGWGAKVYVAILAVVVAPVVEEMLFRGVLLPVITKIAGIRAALVIVALLFSLVHGFYMPAGLLFFILSIAFSLAYIYRGSLLTPIMMHAVFNGITMVVLWRM